MRMLEAASEVASYLGLLHALKATTVRYGQIFLLKIPSEVGWTRLEAGFPDFPGTTASITSRKVAYRVIGGRASAKQEGNAATRKALGGLVAPETGSEPVTALLLSAACRRVRPQVVEGLSLIHI